MIVADLTPGPAPPGALRPAAAAPVQEAAQEPRLPFPWSPLLCDPAVARSRSFHGIPLYTSSSTSAHADRVWLLVDQHPSSRREIRRDLPPIVGKATPPGTPCTWTRSTLPVIVRFAARADPPDPGRQSPIVRTPPEGRALPRVLVDEDRSSRPHLAEHVWESPATASPRQPSARMGRSAAGRSGGMPPEEGQGSVSAAVRSSMALDLRPGPGLRRPLRLSTARSRAEAASRDPRPGAAPEGSGSTSWAPSRRLAPFSGSSATRPPLLLG